MPVQSSSSSASSTSSAGPPTPPIEPPSALITSLTAFARQLSEKEHLLATSSGDDELARKALEVTKSIFDTGLSLEPASQTHIQTLITQLLDPSSLPSTSPSTRPTTRQSSSRRSRGPNAAQLYPPTPLGELYTQGLDEEGVWRQMEMKGGKMGEVLKVLEILPAGRPGAEEDEEETVVQEEQDSEQEDDEDEEGEDELTPEEMEQWQALLKEKPEMFSEWDSEDEEGDENENIIGGDDEDEDEDEDDETDDEDMEEDEDEMDVDLDDDAEDEEDDLMDDMEDDLEELEQDDEEEEEDEDLDSSHSKPNHPTLDDQFFSIDAFNRFTEESEATSTSSGSLGSKKKGKKVQGKRKGLLGEEDDEEEDDDDEEEDDLGLDSEVGDLFGGDILAEAGDEGDNMMYSDFFPPPREWTREKPTKGKGKSNGGTEKPKKKSSAKAAPAETAIESEADGRDTMSRVRTDLFADDDDDDEDADVDAPTARLSTHEKRLRALQEQISSLEQENVGKKDWTLLGEAKSKDRPQNSLLEEDLEFEQMGKVVPIVTEDKVVNMEEMIKRRILDDNFDDVVRRRELDDKAFIPSRYFELDNAESSKSLAQIYEDDYKNAANGGKIEDARDVKLNKDHEEIDSLWGEICYKLDALSNLNFTPKQPKAAITTLSNVATTSMENALPTTQSTSTMLAPEEMFAPASKNDLVARSELDPSQKKRMRQKDRKTRMRQRQALDSAVDKFAGKSGGGGKARGGVKSQKDRALKELVKTGKGVTVVGKDSVKKPRGDRQPRESVSQSSTLKL